MEIFKSHSIHVWYIYPKMHVVKLYGKCICQPPGSYGNGLLFFFVCVFLPLMVVERSAMKFGDGIGFNFWCYYCHGCQDVTPKDHRHIHSLLKVHLDR